MDFSLISLWSEMGAIPKGVVILLSFMSVMTFAVVVVRFIALNKSNNQSLRFADVASDALKNQHVKECIDAADQPEYKQSHVARVVGAGLKEFQITAGDRGMVLDNVDRAMDRSIETERHTLSSGLGILATIASTAPYIGLFGTVFGIIHTFQKMGAAGGGGLEVIAGGIAEALYATAFGLFVAIFSVWFYNFLYSRVEQYEVDMSNSKLEIMTYVDKNRSRAGAALPAARAGTGSGTAG